MMKRFVLIQLRKKKEKEYFFKFSFGNYLESVFCPSSSPPTPTTAFLPPTGFRPIFIRAKTSSFDIEAIRSFVDKNTQFPMLSVITFNFSGWFCEIQILENGKSLGKNISSQKLPFQMDPITDWFLIQNNLFEGNPSSCALLPAATLLTNKLSGGGRSGGGRRLGVEYCIQ